MYKIMWDTNKVEQSGTLSLMKIALPEDYEVSYLTTLKNVNDVSCDTFPYTHNVDMNVTNLTLIIMIMVLQIHYYLINLQENPLYKILIQIDPPIISLDLSMDLQMMYGIRILC